MSHECEFCKQSFTEEWELLHHMVMEHNYLGRRWVPDTILTK
jgi:hypothetical protein